MAQLKFVRVLQVALLSLVVSLGFWGFSSSNSNLLVDVVQARAKFDATTVSENSMPFVIVDSEAGVSSVVDNINNEIRVQLVVLIKFQTVGSLFTTIVVKNVSRLTVRTS